MKKKVAFLLCMLCIMYLPAQESETELGQLEVKPPKFMVENGEGIKVPGDIYTYIHENFVCPNPGRITFGTALIYFDINMEGKPENFEIINSVSNDIDKALVSLLKETEGMWISGKNDGVPVTMEKEIVLKIKRGVSEQTAERIDYNKRGVKKFQRGNKLMFVKDAPQRALRQYDKAIRLLPTETSLYISRGLCHYSLGNMIAARKDWDLLREMGGVDLDNNRILTFRNEAGYELMAQIIAKK